MEKEFEEVIQDIRNLRDSDNHICPAAENSSEEYCSCNEYDLVIDKLEALKNTALLLTPNY